MFSPDVSRTIDISVNQLTLLGAIQTSFDSFTGKLMRLWIIGVINQDKAVVK